MKERKKNAPMYIMAIAQQKQLELRHTLK